MKALYIASSGMAAQERNVEVISNNIANMRTTGFKKQRAEFQDLLYQQYRRAGSQTSEAGTMVPTGVEVGSGVKTAATSRIMSTGDITSTEKQLDIAIQGDGFFSIQLPDGRTGYTRDGAFKRDAGGEIVTTDGYQVEPGITIPGDARSVSISEDGIVEAYIGNDTQATELGQLQVANFVNKSGLRAIGGNMFVETEASGPAQISVPGAEGMGTLMQGYLELSNVNAVTEISDLISAQRAYEMNSRVVSGADEMMSSVSNMR